MKGQPIDLLMIATIDGLTVKDSGRFLQNDGKDQPW